MKMCFAFSLSSTKEFMFFLALLLGTACLELTFIFSWRNFPIRVSLPSRANDNGFD